jgi:hypothetical protein
MEPRYDWKISGKVLQWMTDNLPSNARVVELGGGDGSEALQSAFFDCITVEHDREWARKLIAQGLNVYHCPLEQNYYRPTEQLRALLASADAIVVDGPQGRMRVGFVRYLKTVQHKAVLVIDDTHRPYMKRVLKHTTVEIIRDEHRTTHIQHAHNPQNATAENVGIEEGSRGQNQSDLQHTEMAEVSAVVPEDEPTVRPVRKTSKRGRPQAASKGTT